MSASPQPVPALPWWQFSLRWLFVLMVVVAAVCAYFGRNWARQSQVRAFAAEMRSRGHDVSTDAEWPWWSEPRAASWTDSFLAYPSVYVVWIRPKDPNFATFPWEWMKQVGDVRVIVLDHPEVKDEHVAMLTEFSNLYCVSVIDYGQLTQRGLDDLANCPRLSQVTVLGHKLPANAWQFLETMSDASTLDLWVRPEQVPEIRKYIGGRKFAGLRLVCSVRTYEPQIIDTPHASSMQIDGSLLRGIRVTELHVAGGWLAEEEMLAILDENPGVRLSAYVDRLSEAIIPRLKQGAGCELNALDASPGIVELRGSLALRLPKLSQEMAIALREHDGPSGLRILVAGPQCLPPDVSGLEVSSRGSDTEVRKAWNPHQWPPTAPWPLSQDEQE